MIEASNEMGGISGKWFNPRTGDTVFVRSNVMDGDDMIIITDKGHMKMDQFSQYVQVDENTVYDNVENSGQMPSMSVDVAREMELIKQPNKPSTITPVDNDPFTIDVVSVSNNKNENKINNKKTTQKSKQNTNTILIDKVFKKIETKPTIMVTINWDDFPRDQINTLINFLDVKQEEISDYMINNYLSKDALILVIDNFLEEHI